MGATSATKICRCCGKTVREEPRRRVNFTVQAEEMGWRQYISEVAYFCLECAPTSHQIHEFAESFIAGIKAQQVMADDALHIPGLPQLVYELYNEFGKTGFTRLQAREAGVLPMDSRQHTGLSDLLKQEWLRAETIEGTHVYRYFIGDRALALLQHA